MRGDGCRFKLEKESIFFFFLIVNLERGFVEDEESEKLTITGLKDPKVSLEMTGLAAAVGGWY